MVPYVVPIFYHLRVEMRSRAEFPRPAPINENDRICRTPSMIYIDEVSSVSMHLYQLS